MKILRLITTFFWYFTPSCYDKRPKGMTLCLMPVTDVVLSVFNCLKHKRTLNISFFDNFLLKKFGGLKNSIYFCTSINDK